jgi:chromosome segregation ATPase
MPMVVPVLAATMIAAGTEVASGNAFLTLAALVLTSGVVTAFVNGWLRKRSGEDRSSAAQDVGEAASSMAGAVEDLLRPYREENAKLIRTEAELRQKYAAKSEEVAKLVLRLAETQHNLTAAQATATAERHAHGSELATLAARVADLELTIRDREDELDTLRIQLGEQDDRRGEDRRH